MNLKVICKWCFEKCLITFLHAALFQRVLSFITERLICQLFDIYENCYFAKNMYSISTKWKVVVLYEKKYLTYTDIDVFKWFTYVANIIGLVKSIQIFFRITLRLIFYLIGAFFFVESNYDNDVHVLMISYNIPFSL